MPRSHSADGKPTLQTDGPLVLLTQDEAAAMLRMSKSSIARLRRIGELAYLPGRPVKIKLQELNGWLSARQIRHPRSAVPVPEKLAASPARLGKRLSVLRRR